MMVVTVACQKWSTMYLHFMKMQATDDIFHIKPKQGVLFLFFTLDDRSERSNENVHIVHMLADWSGAPHGDKVAQHLFGS